jgi:choline transport protein
LIFNFLYIENPPFFIMATNSNREKAPSPSYDSDKGTMPEKDHEPQFLEVNEAGHVQELERNFSLFSICSVGIVTGNTWAALGGSIAVAI